MKVKYPKFTNSPVHVPSSLLGQKLLNRYTLLACIINRPRNCTGIKCRLNKSRTKMMKLIKVEVIKRETIKPSSSTPHHLRCFKLSFLDQLAPAVYSSLVLFYPIDGDHTMKSTEKSRCLMKSLSDTLIHFYPLAGRIKDSVSIDCNDDGAEYLEARVNCSLSDILRQPEAEIQHLFLPGIESSSAALLRPLLLVQANFFECGGMAIGVCISHKLTDAATFGTFIKAWAAIAVESKDRVLLPELINVASLFPPRDLPISLPTVNLTNTNCISRRYVFDASKIATLKAKVASASASVKQPTRVEVVSALIWKCAMKASRSNSKLIRVSVMSQAVNMRKRIVPPLPENSFGNLNGSFAIQIGEESEIELQSLVSEIRKGIAEFSDNYVKKLQGDKGFLVICEYLEEAGNLLKSEDVDFYAFTSWCRFPFYEANFGWGKPIWVGIASWAYKNFVVLMDTRDGEGIEAWVFLSEEDMGSFQHDHELLTFASLNPSVLNMAFES